MAEDLDEAAVRRAIEAVLATWVEPEIARRRATGLLPTDFELTMFQVISDEAGRAREVRLNDEVRAAVRWPSRREDALNNIRFGDPNVQLPEIILTGHDPN